MARIGSEWFSLDEVGAARGLLEGGLGLPELDVMDGAELDHGGAGAPGLDAGGLLRLGDTAVVGVVEAELLDLVLDVALHGLAVPPAEALGVRERLRFREHRAPILLLYASPVNAPTFLLFISSTRTLRKCSCGLDTFLLCFCCCWNCSYSRLSLISFRLSFCCSDDSFR